MEPDLDMIQKCIGYVFRDQGLLRQAFIRPSYTAERGGPDCFVFRTAGEKILDLAVIGFLASTFGDLRGSGGETYYILKRGEYRESKFCGGDLQAIRQKISAEGYLTRGISSLGLDVYLISGAPESATPDRMKEELLYAILGAVAFDSGWDMPEVFHVANVLADIESSVFHKRVDGEKYLEALRDRALGNGGKLPVYSYTGGPDGERACELTIPSDGEPVFRGTGRNEASARRAAAREAYFALLQSGEIRNAFREAVGTPDPEDPLSQINKLVSSGMIEKPAFSFSRPENDSGNGLGDCTLTAKRCDISFTVTAADKEDARRECAFEFLRYLTYDFDSDD